MKQARRLAWIGIGGAVVIAAVLFLFAGWSAFGGPFDIVRDEALRHSEEAYVMVHESNQRLIEAWWDHQLFAWKWWVSVGLTAGPWIVWVLLRRKESTHRLLYIGAVLIILASYLDFLGVTYGLWRYHIEIIPTIPSYIPWDFCIYPVVGMFFFQYEPGLSRYLKALLFAFSGALVVEPTFILLQFYEPVNWWVFYSLPIHFVNYLIADWFGRQTEFQPLHPEAARPPWNPPDTSKLPGTRREWQE